ncbi:MAG: ABC transporter permease [Chloroflexi bacterium]|nr:ABC transporter permease [Chloroflexota bacterium]
MALFVMARLTFLEAIRRRILLAALVLGIAFLSLYGVGFYVMRDMRNGALLQTNGPDAALIGTAFNSFLSLAGLYGVNFLAIAMAALLSADTLAGEIGSGTIQAIVTKPIRRAEIVLGKWLGFAGLLALYLALMAGGVMAIAYAGAGYVVPNPLAGVVLIYLETLLVMTVTLAFSSMLPTLATGGVIFGLYGVAFIGGWVEQFGALVRNQAAVDVGIISSLLIPSEALWRRAAFEMTPAVAQAFGVVVSGPFISISIPSPLMVEYGLLYLVVALLIAVRQFSRRDL